MIDRANTAAFQTDESMRQQGTLTIHFSIGSIATLRVAMLPMERWYNVPLRRKLINFEPDSRFVGLLIRADQEKISVQRAGTSRQQRSAAWHRHTLHDDMSEGEKRRSAWPEAGATRERMKQIPNSCVRFEF